MSGSPQRIICLTEEPTELLYLLGESHRIVGVSSYTVRPIQAKVEKPKVSSFLTGNIQKIKNLKPDLVIGFSDIQSQLASDLIKEGLNVLITNQRSISEIFDTMLLLGRIVSKEKEVVQLLDGWKRKLETFATKAPKNKPKVFFQEWEEPIISSIQWVSELIEICGGEDIFSGTPKPMAKDRIVSIADIESKNPDIIIGSWCGKKMDLDWIQKNLHNTKAVQNNRIREIDSSIILQPGPALFLEGIDAVFECIHNEN